MLAWGFSVLGLIILLISGDALVKGAVNLSLRLGVPALIISLTIVAFGTSAPELLIAIQATLEDAPGLALGNVVGSNTANILLVLGVPALLFSLDTTQCAPRVTYLFMLFSSLVFIALAATGVFDVWQAAILLALLAVYLYKNFKDATDQSVTSECGMVDPDDELEGADPSLPSWKIGAYLAVGLIGLPVGADLLVESATEIARRYHVSDAVIGLTLVAIGTSLPELATTVMSAYRKQADVALGNVIGSNIFNLLAIVGVAALVDEISVPRDFVHFDLWIMFAASLLIAPFVFLSWKIGRIGGTVLTALYVLYVLSVLH